jgi:death-on-curing protein
VTGPEPARLQQAEREIARYWGIRAAHDTLADEWDDIVIGDEGVLHDNVIWLAAGQPYITVWGEPAYPTEWEQAAVAMRIIAQRHPFSQGNKRTAWLHTVGMLHDHVLPRTVSQGGIIALVMAVAKDQLSNIMDIAQTLREVWGV